MYIAIIKGKLLVNDLLFFLGFTSLCTIILALFYFFFIKKIEGE
jgi:hypothetical protein